MPSHWPPVESGGHIGACYCRIDVGNRALGSRHLGCFSRAVRRIAVLAAEKSATRNQGLKAAGDCVKSKTLKSLASLAPVS